MIHPNVKQLSSGDEHQWDYVILDEGHRIKNPAGTSRPRKVQSKTEQLFYCCPQHLISALPPKTTFLHVSGSIIMMRRIDFDSFLSVENSTNARLFFHVLR
jgi:hypothetical protein